MVIDIERQGIFKQKYTFQIRGESFGWLEYKKFYSRQATMSWESEIWNARRRGVFRKELALRKEDAKEDSFRFPLPNFKDFKFSWEGAGYTLKKNGIFGTKYSWLNDAGREVMEFRRLEKKRAEIIVSLSFQDSPHLKSLAFLGWYLILCYREDRRAAAAGA